MHTFGLVSAWPHVLAVEPDLPSLWAKEGGPVEHVEKRTYCCSCTTSGFGNANTGARRGIVWQVSVPWREVSPKTSQFHPPPCTPPRVLPMSFRAASNFDASWGRVNDSSFPRMGHAPDFNESWFPVLHRALFLASTTRTRSPNSLLKRDHLLPVPRPHGSCDIVRSRLLRIPESEQERGRRSPTLHSDRCSPRLIRLIDDRRLDTNQGLLPQTAVIVLLNFFEC